jgi:regulator of protease activity HflC (stomatin/prohibitin superfamily)
MIFTKKPVMLIIAIIIVAVIIFSCFEIVGAGHTGVVSTFGKISDDVMQEGFNLKAPWQKVTKVDNRISMLTVSTDAFSSDLQTVSVVVAVNYRIDTSKSYYIIKNIGKDYEDILVTPSVNEVLKQIIAKYTAEESITNRAIISTELLDGLNEKLNDSGIYVSDINIIDFDFSDTYIDAIEAKQVAEQSKLKAQIEQEQLTMEKEAQAERDIIAAEAALEVSKIEAEAVEFAGQKEAAANKAISESITEELVEYYKVQAWDGALPTITGNDSVITMTGMTD